VQLSDLSLSFMKQFAQAAELAVVIPVHNGRAYTAHCLELMRELEGPDMMVIVVDDGSSDGTSSYLEDNYPDVHLLHGSGNLWWSGAVDFGCRFAIDRGASRLLLLNNDNLEMSPNLMPELERVLDEYGGLAGAVMVEDRPNGRREIVAAGGRLNWRSRGIELRDGPREAVVHRIRAEDVECDWLPGASLAFGREVFLDLEGFDARAFPQYRGDVDFTTRARKAGYKCVVTYAAWVVNDTRQTWINFGRRLTYREFGLGLVSFRSAYNLRETIRFAWRHCPKRWLIPYLGQFYLRYAYAFWKTRHRLPKESSEPRPDDIA
jgi:GT2 family glycosyltransferase